jgi:hypothetical protein
LGPRNEELELSPGTGKLESIPRSEEIELSPGSEGLKL